MAPGLSPTLSSRRPAPTENSPLLPRKRQDEEQHDGYNAASFASGVFSLSTIIVGAGIMGLPATMSTIGLVPGIGMIVFVAFLTNASIDFMLNYSKSGKSLTYGGLMADSFGRIGRTFLQVCVIVNNFGLLAVYLIIIADVLSGSTSSSVRHAGVLEQWAGGETWWNGRIVVIFFTTAFVLSPLVSFRHVDSLRLSSALSVALAVLFVVITTLIAGYKIAAGTISKPKLFPEFDNDASTIFSYFSVVPVVVTAYICHHTVHPVINELEKASHAQGIVRTSLTLCTTIYVMTSVFGYLLFGDDTYSDVLSNFDVDLGVPYSTVLSDIVRVGYAVHIMLVFPLLNFSLRVNLDELLFPSAPALSKDTRRFFMLTTCVVALAVLTASFVPSIWDAFQITGSTAGVCLGFIFPGILVLRDVHGIATRQEKFAAWFMVVLAIGSSIIALTGDIYDIFD